MFALFLNDQLKDFWGNKIGEQFLIGTCESLKLDASKIDLVFYHTLDSVPEYFEIDASKKLIIKSRTVTQVESQDAEGNAVTTEVEIFSVEKEIEPDHFMTKGLMIKPC